MSSLVCIRPLSWTYRLCQYGRVYQRSFASSGRMESTDKVVIKTNSSTGKSLYAILLLLRSLSREENCIQGVEN